MSLDTRVYTITTSSTLVTESCCSCGIVFAMPKDFRDEALNDHSRSFYCPNGHGQSYVGKSEQEKRAEKAERDATWLRQRLDQEKAELADTKNRLRAQKAAKTRARNRAARGQCPATGCRRPFANVAEHVRTEHPELAAATDRLE